MLLLVSSTSNGSSSPPSSSPMKRDNGHGTRKMLAPVSCKPVTQAGTDFTPSCQVSSLQKCIQLQCMRSYLLLGHNGNTSHLIKFHTSQSCILVVPRFTD